MKSKPWQRRQLFSGLVIVDLGAGLIEDPHMDCRHQSAAGHAACLAAAKQLPKGPIAVFHL